MTDTMFFLNRLAAEPHAHRLRRAVHAVDCLPWPTRPPTRCWRRRSRSIWPLPTGCFTPVSADLLAANGRPVDLFGFDANPAKLGPAADAAASVPGIALAQLGRAAGHGRPGL